MSCRAHWRNRRRKILISNLDKEIKICISEKNKNCRWAVYEKSIFVASKFLLEKIFYLKDDYVNKIWECNTTEYTI